MNEKYKQLEDLNEKFQEDWKQKRRKKLKSLVINTIIMTILVIIYFIENGYDYFAMLTFLNSYGLIMVIIMEGYNDEPSRVSVTIEECENDT